MKESAFQGEGTLCLLTKASAFTGGLKEGSARDALRGRLVYYETAFTNAR